MPNHVIRDRIWDSKKLRRCSMAAAMAYPWVFLVADDWGRFEYDPARIWSKVFGGRKDVAEADVEAWLTEYEREGLLIRYSAGGEMAFWTKFEGRPPSKRRPSHYPQPPEPKEKRKVPRLKADGTPQVPGGYPLAEIEQESRAEQELGAGEQSKSGVPAAGEAPGNGNGALSKLETYARSIWKEHCRRRGSELPEPSNADYELMRSWYEASIPYSAVIRAFQDTKAIKSNLSYYGPSVKERAAQRGRALA